MRSLLPLLCFAVAFTGSAAGQGSCATPDYLHFLQRTHPGWKTPVRNGATPQYNIANTEWLSGTAGQSSNVLPVIRIPVVVHVLYNRSEQNISDDQIASQIETLNNEFRKRHADTSLIPAHFRSIAADCYIEFALAKVDPKGYATTGIVRKRTAINIFGMDDRIKHTADGGDNAWNSDRYLNIWVGNLVGGIIGYSSPLGGPPETDGIAIAYYAFGSRGTMRAPYTKGRTLMHEVGHWLGLKHIWGDKSCGSDEVDDTPPQSGPTRGCPGGIVRSCSNNDGGNMYNNYMDLTNDGCTNMFTTGQRDKMREAFLPGNPRNTLLGSTALTATPIAGAAPTLDSVDALQVSCQIYPNPATDRVRVVLTGAPLPEGNTLTIHNGVGQLVLMHRFSTSTIDVDIHSLHEGIYFIRVNGRSTPVKLIKAGRAY